MTTLVFPKHGVDTRVLCQKLKQNYSEYQHEGHYHIFLNEDDPTVCVHQIEDRVIVILGTPVVNGEFTDVQSALVFLPLTTQVTTWHFVLPLRER